MKFMDFPGLWQHFSVPVDELTEAIFEEGLGFDGSSIRGWQAIHASDMLVVPDAETAVMDPFTKYPTLSLICNIVDPITKERYSRDPRHIAQKAEAYLKSTGIGDTCYMGPEPEFFIFDDVRFDQNSHEGYYHIDSVGRHLEQRPRGKPEPRLQAPPQGRLFPGAAHRLPGGHPHRDGGGDAEGRHLRRETAPRGGDRRPGRDRHAVQHPGQVRRPAHVCSSTSSRTLPSGTTRP